MPTATEQFDLVYTGTSQEGNTETLNLTITVDTATTTEGSFTGHLITAISGDINGHAVTLLSAGGYNGNDNLFSPTGQAFDVNGFSFSADGDKFNLYDDGTPPNVSYGLSDFAGTAEVLGGTLTITPVCFCSGTLIRTARGEIAVENLKVGDEAITASGEARPIVWIGSRTMKQPAPEHRPVRVAAGAFGENRPARDLMLSPGHAVCVKVMDEVFIPVSRLLNGATVVQIEVPEVTYWHVELESHDVLLAEGLGCESYMDAGNRGWFAGRAGSPDPERVEASLAAYARPFVDEGAVLEAVRHRLFNRAEALGWRREREMDIHLLVDGARVEPDVDGDLARFLFPASAKDVRLMSAIFSPSWTADSGDQRELGLAIQAIHISDGLRVNREVLLEQLAEGFHSLEGGGETAWRWSNGAGRIPAALWGGCKGQVILRVTSAPKHPWAWSAPQENEASAEEPSKVVPIRVA